MLQFEEYKVKLNNLKPEIEGLDKALGIELPGYRDWVKALEKASGEKVDSYEKLEEVLLSRIDLFEKMGCRASDHAFTRVPYKRADAAELDRV